MTIKNTQKRGKFRSFATLRIKAASLAAESRIIRREEIKAKRAGDEVSNRALYLHRMKVVRVEARRTQIAIAYLRGRHYGRTELNNKWENRLSDNDRIAIWSAIQRHAGTYVGGETAKDLDQWLDFDQQRPNVLARRAERAAKEQAAAQAAQAV